MRPALLSKALAYHVANTTPCGVLSAPGMGKSDLIKQAARDAGLPLITMNLGLSDATDIKGLPFIVTDEDGTRYTEWLKQKQLLTKEPICLFLDELFQAQTLTMCAAAPIILEQRIDDIYLPKGSWVVFASNRLEDKAGVNRVPSIIPNRCTMFNLETNIEDWSGWALDNGLDVRVIQFLRMKPSCLHDWDSNRAINATPRQWEWVARHLEHLPEDIAYDTIAGRVGEGPAAELRGFCKWADQLPAKETILLNPKKAPVPEEPSALYMVAGMLAHAASPTNFDAVCEYAKRIPPEYQAMLVKDAMRLSPKILSTKAFLDWGVRFAEVLS
jgi:hypothetical protein